MAQLCIVPLYFYQKCFVLVKGYLDEKILQRGTLLKEI